jgi:sec-independent protein translocase protein TatC
MARSLFHDDGLPMMGLGDHLEELRIRVMRAVIGLVVGVVIVTAFGTHLFHFLCQPFYDAMKATGHVPVLKTWSTGEKMVVYFKVTALFGALVASPYIFYQFWKFVSAGLFAKERRYVHILAPFSAFLFITGAMFFIKVMAPITLQYFINFDIGVDYVQTESTLANHIDFMVMMSLVFGLGFQLPLVVVGLNKLGIMSVELLNKWRKYIVLLLAIVAGVLTPPDVVSQIALGVPLYVLFELSVLFCWLTGKASKKGTDDIAPEQ